MSGLGCRVTGLESPRRGAVPLGHCLRNLHGGPCLQAGLGLLSVLAGGLPGGPLPRLEQRILGSDYVLFFLSL